MSTRLTSALLLMALTLSACHRQSLPDGVMNHSQMVDFLTETYMLESYYAVANGFDYGTVDTNALGNYKELLQRQGLTAAQVEASKAYYADHLEEYAAIHDEVLARLKEIGN